MYTPIKSIFWGRQKIDLIGVYMHASDYQHNVSMISGTLRQWHQAAPSGTVIARFNDTRYNDIDGLTTLWCVLSRNSVKSRSI
jgi:hypothetical protein